MLRNRIVLAPLICFIWDKLHRFSLFVVAMADGVSKFYQPTMTDLLWWTNLGLLDQELFLKDLDLKRYQKKASLFTTYVPRRAKVRNPKRFSDYWNFTFSFCISKVHNSCLYYGTQVQISSIIIKASLRINLDFLVTASFQIIFQDRTPCNSFYLFIKSE